MPEKMLTKWEQENLKNQKLSDIETEFRKLRYIFPLQVLTIGSIAFLSGWFVVTFKFGELGVHILLVVTVALSLAVIFIPNPVRKRFRLEEVFEDLERDFRVNGFLQYVEKGYDYNQIRRAVDNRLVDEAQTVLLVQEEFKQKRKDDKCSEDEIEEVLERRRLALMAFDFLWKQAALFGLEPGGRSMYFDQAKGILSAFRS